MQSFFRILLRQLRCLRNGAGVQWFCCTRTRLMYKIETTKGVLSCSATLLKFGRVVEMRVRRGVSISENQFEFTSRHSTTEGTSCEETDGKISRKRDV
uniref:Putative ovule protein n=1 Tax=Solanum chacoense TaxID=4108 RepID=A0A0V0GXI8_SOLCH